MAVPTKQLKVSTIRAGSRTEASFTSIEVGDHIAYITGGYGGGLAYATTNGKTLAPRAMPRSSGLRGTRIIDGTLWMVGEYGLCAMSTDRAATWTRIAMATSECLWDIACDAKGVYWICGSGGTLLRAATGTERTFKPVKHDRKPRDERTNPRIEITPAGLQFPLFNARWDGKALVAVKGLKGANAALATSPDTATIVMVGDRGAAFRSTDGGTSFTAVATGATAHFNDVAFVAGGFIAVGAGGAMRRSEDDGVTWKPLASKTKVELRSIGSWGGGAFVGGEKGVVLRIDSPGDTYWKGTIDDFAPKPVVPAKVTPLRVPTQAQRDARFATLFAEATTSHAALAAKVKPAPASEHDDAILAAIDDVDTYAVVGDALQASGDARGELVALQIANNTKAADTYFAKHRAALLGDLSGFAADAISVKWRWGYIHAARVAYPDFDTWEANDESDTVVTRWLSALLAEPSARYLQDLTVGIVDYEENAYDNVIKAIAKSVRPALRSLYLGDFEQHETEISWSTIGDVSKLYGAVGNLEKLALRSGVMTLGKLVLPRLRRLEIVTGGLTKQSLAAIEKAALPSLEELSLCFGTSRYGCDIARKDLTKLLSTDRFPRLRHLGLRNTEFSDELATVLHTSTLVAQVRELDLSLGTLSDTGAHALASYAGGLAHLEKLDVSRCYLGKRGIGHLIKAFPNAEVVTEGQRLRAGRELETRYVAISE